MKQQIAKTIRKTRDITYSIWLFTYSDLKTIVFPKTVFAVATLCSGERLIKGSQPEIGTIAGAVTAAALWTWLNLLPLTMLNQYDEDSIKEDAENKPWRPIPAGRISSKETRVLMVGGYLIAMLGSLGYLGGSWESVALLVEGLVYNRIQAGNGQFLVRNMLNAVGYMTFASGAARVAATYAGTMLREETLGWWLLLLGGIIATTIQFQDLYDQRGDSLRGRKTIPLLASDRVARMTVAAPILVWSCVASTFWELSSYSSAPQALLGIFIVYRLFRYRGPRDDKKSFLLWNLWVMILYCLPMGSKV
ncbi:MAG: hypothetical protein Q9168_002468 [Polycauliona sp. 1 TL-2023]